MIRALELYFVILDETLYMEFCYPRAHMLFIVGE